MPCTGRSWAPASEPKSTAFCKHLALVVQAADVDHERHGGEEDHDGERGQDGDGAVFVLHPFRIMLLPPRAVGVITPRTSTPTASGAFIVVPRPGTKEPIGVIML